MGVSDHNYDPWIYRSSAGYSDGLDLTGYKIAAADGDLGKVDGATYETGSASLVIDTCPWLLGRKVLLPAGVVERVDTDEELVYVDRTRDQIKDSPDYDPDHGDVPSYRDEVGTYYGRTYRSGL